MPTTDVKEEIDLYPMYQHTPKLINICPLEIKFTTFAMLQTNLMDSINFKNHIDVLLRVMHFN